MIIKQHLLPSTKTLMIFHKPFSFFKIIILDNNFKSITWFSQSMHQIILKRPFWKGSKLRYLEDITLSNMIENCVKISSQCLKVNFLILNLDLHLQGCPRVHVTVRFWESTIHAKIVIFGWRHISPSSGILL